MQKLLLTVSANNSWVQALVAAMPELWTIHQYRIYSPQWLPGGARDLLKCMRPRQIGPRLFEHWIVVPGWGKFPGASSAILSSVLAKRIGEYRQSSAVLYTFPFYSRVAKSLAASGPDLMQAYWAHDAFAFYKFPQGYIATHEQHIIPTCQRHFAMTPLLVEDYRQKFPQIRFDLLRDAVSADFIAKATKRIAPPLVDIRRKGQPVVGCIGQINESYDWDLLEAAADAFPHTQFVFVGNIFEEGAVTERIRGIFCKSNVHWLGPVQHEHLPEYLSGFDICLNPLSRTAHNHRRDPLRIYDYLTTDAPIFSLELDGARHHGPHVEWFDVEDGLFKALGKMPDMLSQERLRARQRYIAENTWQSRAHQLATSIASCA